MNQKYIGKTCPYCLFPIKNEHKMIICPNCEQPHHSECWKANDGCTTFSCGCKSLPKNYVQNNKLVINLEDLPLDDRESCIYPSLSNESSYNLPSNRDSGISNALWQLAFAGFFGGVIVWLIALTIFSFDYYAKTEIYDQILIETAFFAAILGGVICAALSSAEGIASKVFSKTISGIFSGIVIGAVGGFFGAIIGHQFYDSLESMKLDSNITNYAIRGLFWSLVGLFIGLGQGIGTGGGKKIINGLIGGVVGGFVAGFIFDYFFVVFTSADLSGFVAITLFGIFIGLAIGTVQEIRKEAWLKVLEGTTKGKEYIIYREKTLIGRSTNNDIVLINDSEVALRHAEIKMDNNVYIIYDCQSTSGVWLRNKRVTKWHLKNQDIITIGGYKMQFNERVRG